MATKNPITVLEEKIWKILLAKGSGMLTPQRLKEKLENDGTECSWEEMSTALCRLETKKRIFYGTLGVIWIKT